MKIKHRSNTEKLLDYFLKKSRTINVLKSASRRKPMVGYIEGDMNNV